MRVETNILQLQSSLKQTMDEPATIWHFDQRIQSKVEASIALVREVIKRLKRYDWTEKDVFSVHMALEETLMNAIKHGNCNDCSKQVHAVIDLREDCILVRIEDEGDGFDPQAVPDPCQESNLGKTSGRGLILINSFVDEIQYVEPGNIVEFRKDKSDSDSE